MKEKLDRNFASDEKFATEIMTNLLEIWASCKSQREYREEIWQRSYRSWSIDHTEADKNYTGVANLKIPQLRKEIETMSRRIYKALLPDDYLKGETATGFANQELITVNTQVVRHYYDNVIKIKKPLYPWTKQLVILGTSPIRQFWDKKTNEMFYKKRVPYTDAQGVIRFKAEPTREEITVYNAPKLRAEDLFNTWVYPTNAQTPDDIEITFYRTLVKKNDLEKKAKEGMCVRFDEFKDSGKSATHVDEESQERMAQFADSGEFRSLQGNNFFELLEIWCLLELPGSSKPVSCVVEIIDRQFCTRIQRNPYWHQMTPFDFGRFIIPPPGEFYGRGLPEAAISLQHQLDDTMNQTMDATTLALNNITIINPAYAPNAESFEVEPGAVWWADPAAVKQFTFPDLTDTGYKAAGTIRNWISEMSDNQPQLPDPIAGKARSTGQAQMAINEWQTDLFTFIDFISVEALSNMAFKTHSLLQQFLEDDDVIRVSGKYADTWIQRVVTPQDLVGRYKFNWIGALQIENQSIKTQQMLNFINVYKNLPPEAQQEVRMRWQNYTLKLMRDGFQIKDVENIVETDKLSATTPPELEEKILSLGGDIEVVKSDDDAAHLQYHQLEHAKDKNPLTRAYRSKHMEEHRKQQEEKIQEIKRMEMQMATLQAQGPQAQRPEGNVSQIPQSVTQDNLERGQRVGAGQS